MSRDGKCVAPSAPAPTCATIATKDACLANASCSVQNNGSCVDRCPGGTVVCASTGACAPSAAQCVVCSSSQVQCWDSTCVGAEGDCTCKPGLVRCRANASDGGVDECATPDFCNALLATSCARDAPVLCGNGSCAASAALCPCPSARPIACPVVGAEVGALGFDGAGAAMPLCVLTAAECSACPPGSVRCWNGACAERATGCACNASAPQRCPIGLGCAASLLDCPCATAQLTRCANDATVCVASRDACANTCKAPLVRCGDGSCASSQLLCPCVPDATSLPLLTINIGVTDFDAGLTLRIGALVSFSKCSRDYSADVNVTWAFRYASGAAVASFPSGAVLRGPIALLPAWTFQPGDQVVATATGVVNLTAGVVGSAKVLLAFSVPAPTVSLGSATVVAVHGGAPLVLSASVVDSFKRRAASLAWACCNLTSWGGDVAGSTAITSCTAKCTGFNTTSSAATRTYTNVPVGRYMVTVTYANVTAQQLVVVLPDPNADHNATDGSGATAAPAVLLPRVPSAVISTLRALALNTTDISVAVRFDADWVAGLAFMWSINGSDVAAPDSPYYGKAKAQQAQLLIPGGLLAAGAVYNVSYVVFAQALPALMSADERMVSVVAAPRIACTVVDPAGSAANTTSRSSTVVVQAQYVDARGNALAGDSAAVAAMANFLPQFRFGFYDTVNGVVTSNSLGSADYQDSSFTKAVAPVVAMVGSAGAVTVRFFVALRLQRATDVSVAECSRLLYRPVDNASTVVDDAMQSLRSASAGQQVSTVVSTAVSVATAVSLSSSQPAAGDAAGAARQAQEALGNVSDALQAVVGANGKLLSSEQRSAIVTSIDSLVAARAQTAAAAAVGGTGGPAPIDSGTRAQLLSVVAQTVAASGGDDSASSDTAFNAPRDGAAVLRTLDALDPNATAIAKAVAQALAASADFGAQQSLASGAFAVAGLASAPGAIGGQSVSTNSTSMRLPATFAAQTGVANRTVVSVTASESTSNPFGTRGLAGRDSVHSSVVDFSVTADGANVSVRDLQDAIQLRIRVNHSSIPAPAAGEQSNLTCFYFDETSAAWSRQGVVTVAVDDATGDVACNTTHLSSFAVMVLSFAAAPSPTTGGANGGDDGGSSNTGMIVGIVVGVLVLAVVVLAVVVKMRGSAAGTGQQRHQNDKVDLLAQPMMDVEMHGHGGGAAIDQGGWNAKPVYQAPDTSAVNIEL